MIDLLGSGLWLVLVLLGWSEEPAAMVEIGATLDPAGKS